MNESDVNEKYVEALELCSFFDRLRYLIWYKAVKKCMLNTKFNRQSDGVSIKKIVFT